MLRVRALTLAAATALVGVAAPSTAAGQCADLVAPGAVLHWTSYNNGARFNWGTFTVMLIDERYIEIMSVDSFDPVPRLFLATMAGSIFVAIDSDRRQRSVWIGTCSGNQITGTVRQFTFVVTR